MSVTITNPGAPGAINAASGGLTFAFNNINNMPQLIAPIQANRFSLTIHNPGTVDVFVAPVYVQNNGSDVLLNPSLSQLGGCWRVYANGGTIVITGECQKNYQAFALSGNTNPLTVVDSRVSG